MQNNLKRRELHIGLLKDNMKEEDHLPDLGVNGRIILKWILNRMGRCDLDSSSSR